MDYMGESSKAGEGGGHLGGEMNLNWDLARATWLPGSLTLTVSRFAMKTVEATGVTIVIA